MDKIYIFDTTLRDGEQCPGASLNIKEKIEIAKVLESLNVDVIEAGFPISSSGDFNSVKEISRFVRNATLTGLARANEKDIDVCYDALKLAKNKRIHIFLATSDIHLKYKLKMTREEVFCMAVKAIKYAKKYDAKIEFSAEDASRTDFDFLCKILDEVIKAGADTINIPDTVGYALPIEYGLLIKKIKNNVVNIDKAIISVHCHNDLGLGTANTLSAIVNGARQVECTINGIGERAGNTALEEIVMILKTRINDLKLDTNINTKEIYKASRLISILTGIDVQRNKSIVGANAFLHESGIHQHGVLSNPLTYEILTPESIGIVNNQNIVLGKHSGRHAFIDKLKKLGYNFDDEKMNSLFLKFKELADKKKIIFDEDIYFLINNSHKNNQNFTLKLLSFSSFTSKDELPKSIVKIMKMDQNGNQKISEKSANGDGPIDACYKAINKILNFDIRLEEYIVKANSSEKDAIGNVNIKISFIKNLDKNIKIFSFGKGSSTDIIEASILAYLDAINKIDNEIDLENNFN